MALLDLWQENPDEVQSKRVHQLIAYSGEGKLADGGRGSAEFRNFLSNVPSHFLMRYADECLSDSFPDSGLALQDIVNELGSRLGSVVEPGRYRGGACIIAFDGLWIFPDNHAILVEVKTTDAYRIDLGKIASYKSSLIESRKISEGQSSILIVVGRQDTGDLEAQIRGSRYAWDIRIISVGALIRLLEIKEGLEDPIIVERIHQILRPREFTRLDEIVDVLFKTAEDIKQDDVLETEPAGQTFDNKPKFIPVAFHAACVERIEKSIGKTLIKRSRSKYSTVDGGVAVNCAVSKEHNPGTQPNYWFAFHPHQNEFLEAAKISYVAFGCGSEDRLILMPFDEFKSLQDGLWITSKDGTFYWHVLIYWETKNAMLHRKRGLSKVNLSKYLLTD